MSYSEQDNLVILTMSREDYQALMIYLGFAYGASLAQGARAALTTSTFLEFIDRLNSGKPHYTPYQTGEKKS